MKIVAKTRTLSLIFSAIMLVPAVSIAEQTQEQLLQESRQTIQTFAKGLKGELKEAMKKGGPANAIEVCNTKALKMTAAAGKENAVNLSRTFLKLRNQDNAPQAWQKTVLEQFAARKSKGESAKKMEFSEIVEVDGKKQFRYMKAMGIAKPCLHCHGENALPAVEEKLNRLYPDDKARGYNPGDIRGAIVLTKALN
ncbi:MAG: DUF3365 domain-containing protein [gamma proteobacterium symbiont of Bathyaustriella thionipta]|nr:DUF3365 domain-containing protein [gamma proteobacterium symbiont of Bathyaustriella thionipta]MCU7949563.1 DUF3365 domain-containing protein [gamma proteobacterium symbiont of Bathyaustriella thionipta]MCU7952949.1 DUF3365 domain-containing protein [gamma proteobacterium symbiont of Bathyaustriella thionipta]MCU7956155.1 DUF3365 domain-containing protein [gamma proteobacterium symbiont of Bathyaustriella thionipta]MCU7966681.1 DUF3365 domain-containing protein [gamma proteobacterium symbion